MTWIIADKIAKLVKPSFSANAIPASVSFLVSVVFVTLYYAGGTDVREVFVAAGDIKADSGYLGAFILTGTSAGLLPALVQQLVGMCRKNEGAGREGTGRVQFYHAVCLILYWGCLGMAINFLYDVILINLFGSEANVSTVVYKVLFDEFVWYPVLICHVSSFWLQWLEILKSGGGFSLNKTARVLYYADVKEEEEDGKTEPAPMECDELKDKVEAEQATQVDVAEVLVHVKATPTSASPAPRISCEKYCISASANLLTTWMTFIPTCAIIFSLPSELQMVLFGNKLLIMVAVRLTILLAIRLFSKAVTILL